MGKGKGGKRKKKSPLPSVKNQELYLNRELSWLEFNSRVLSLSETSEVPLLERLKFLSIYSTNLDEFIMKRVGGIKRYKDSDFNYLSTDGMGLEDQLAAIREKVLKDNLRALAAFEVCKKELKERDVELLQWSKVDKKEKEYCDQYFLKNFFPILTPLSVDSGKPFPFISNLSFSFGLLLEHPFDGGIVFSRVKVPDIARKWIELPGAKGRFAHGADIIENNLEHLFRGMKILASAPFKVTRNADWDHDDEDTEDLLVAVEESINERRLQEPIRLEVLEDANEDIVKYLKKELRLEDQEIYQYKDFFDFTSLDSLGSMNRGDLKYSDHMPVIPTWAGEGKLFRQIRRKDRLVHHPYESFTSTVEKFIVNSARDPKVLSIKMTLYRTGDNSPFIKALIEAAENGKQVVCLIELKARFDEKRNIHWARKMEQAGVHVVYGVVGLKTHTKISLVTRQESEGELVQYAHIATGNYNVKTAKIYTDVGILTARPEIVSEVAEVFNYLTGSSLKMDYGELLLAPVNAKSRFIKMIKEQKKLAKNGDSARIIAKMNSLEDTEIIEALYAASEEGVKIDLIIRGFCSLRPGVKGVSENIRVVSVIGRFLEHSRVFYFSDGKAEGEGRMLIGSADWMHRNMHNRVEVITPIYDQDIKDNLLSFLKTFIDQDAKAWELRSDGSYELHAKGDDPQVQMIKLFEREGKK